MWKFILFGVCVNAVCGQSLLRSAIRNLKREIGELQTGQDNIYTMLDFLEVNLTARIDNALGTPSISSSVAVQPGISEDFEERLKNLEGRIDAIKNYLMGEKRQDIKLRKTSETVIAEMKGKVIETETVISDLKKDVQKSLDVFENKIVSVNQTANVKINANGAVLYGGVGSACSADAGECLTSDSECRGGRCQCLPGLSYDVQGRACVDSCKIYGETYQTVSRKIIRGYNDATLDSVSLAECIQKCNEETSFQCRSFDYFYQWKKCYLSSSVKSDVPEDAWEYNSEGKHFQRDCQ